METIDEAIDLLMPGDVLRYTTIVSRKFAGLEPRTSYGICTAKDMENKTIDLQALPTIHSTEQETSTLHFDKFRKIDVLFPSTLYEEKRKSPTQYTPDRKVVHNLERPKV